MPLLCLGRLLLLTKLMRQQIEQNLKFDFAMTGADGKDLQPVFGPGLTGLKNLGNRSVALRFKRSVVLN